VSCLSFNYNHTRTVTRTLQQFKLKHVEIPKSRNRAITKYLAE